MLTLTSQYGLESNVGKTSKIGVASSKFVDSHSKGKTALSDTKVCRRLFEFSSCNP